MEKIINANCLDYMISDEFKQIVKKRKVVIITDPPFNIGYHYSSYKDKMKEQEYLEMLKSVFTMYDIPFVCIHYPEMLYKLAIYISAKSYFVGLQLKHRKATPRHRVF